jgi:ABC-type enterobactin transport system permease subunit
MVATTVMARTLNLAMSTPINRVAKVASQIAIRFARIQGIRKTCGHLLGKAACSKRCG